MKKIDSLVRSAEKARLNSRAAQSGFMVGAALETGGGKVYTGCNVENASYGLTVCAERVAIWKALSEGESKFRRLVVVADGASLTPPCGACRQIIWEYCGDIEIVLAGLHGERRVYRSSALLPMPFDSRALGRRSRRPKRMVPEG